MRTDIPLHTLTRERPADLLPLLGEPDATVLAVESLELPAVSTALDNLLRLRSPGGTVYLHLVEWQGYRDPALLWRVLSYLCWLGQRDPDLVVVVTIIYLQPKDDMGDTLRQVLDGREVLSIPFRVVRLWEQDAVAAVASGLPGMAVLSPLMAGATAELIANAAAAVIAGEQAERRQADLLTILGVFAEPTLETSRFVRLVGRERLMASDLISYLMGERLTELEQAQAALEQDFVQIVEDTVITRFPTTPIALLVPLRQVRDRRRLRELHMALLRAPDQASAERLLRGVDRKRASSPRRSRRP